MKRRLLAMAATAVMLAAGRADAALLVGFEIKSSAWKTVGYTPYGLSSQPKLSGNFTVNPSGFGGTPILDLNYRTGTRNWTENDLTGSPAYFPFPSFTNIAVGFTQGQGGGFFTNGFGSNVNFAAINDNVGGSISCMNCFFVTSTTTTSGIPRSPLAASVIGGWGNAIEHVNKTPSRDEQIQRFQDCLADPSCDLDKVADEIQQTQQQGIGYVREAAMASTDLVNETGFDPTVPAEVILFLLQNGLKLVEEGAALIDLITGRDEPAMATSLSAFGASEVSISAVEGSQWAINESGFRGHFYDVTYDFAGLMPGHNLMTGDSFLTGGGPLGHGAATFQYLDASGTAGQLRIQGFVPQAVPEPSTWAMMILGFAAVGGAMRRRPFATT